MKYFLKKSKVKNKTYLQIYESRYLPSKKQGRNKSYKVIGYVEDIIKKGEIKDPVSYYQKEVEEMNKKIKEEHILEIGDESATQNIGYFMLRSMIDYLEIDGDLNIFTKPLKFQYNMKDLISALIYSQVINPGSKLNYYENVIPSLYGVKKFSYDQILDGLNFIGNDYEKFIELFNHHINEIWPRKTSVAFFDCTNYYFEMDLEKDDCQKGMSKENRRGPIIGQALLLDAEQIPLGMKMYPGNESERPYIRKLINEFKDTYEVQGRIIQIADKGLNCARNIDATLSSKDGYIFSKSINGTNLDTKEKKALLLSDNDKNVWHEVKNKEGKVKYKYKEFVDTFTYHYYVNEFDKKEKYFSVKEKRIVTFTPSLAKKRLEEINREVEKAKEVTSLKQVLKEKKGDLSKYVLFEGEDKKAKTIKVKLNQEKIEEDKLYAGYNLLVTSEINNKAIDIYNAYHGLWRIEESFRIMKTSLEARPVYVSNQNTIYGHFLICYLSLLILRLLEFKVFDKKLCSSELIKFMRKCFVTIAPNECYVNGLTKGTILNDVISTYNIPKLKQLYLRKRDVDIIVESMFSTIN